MSAINSARETIFTAQAMIWVTSIAARSEEQEKQLDGVVIELVLKEAHKILTEATETLGRIEDAKNARARNNKGEV